MKILTSFILILTIAASLAAGDRYGLIIGARAGDQALADTVRAYCLNTRQLMTDSGFKSIDLFTEDKKLANSSEVSLENLNAKFKDLSFKLQSDDELWLFIFGDANINQKGLSLATKGGRLHASKLNEMLEAIQGRQYIFALCRQSSGFMNDLKPDARRFLLCASSDEGEMNPPVLPEFLLKCFNESPGLPLDEIIKKASSAMRQSYQSRNLAVLESPSFRSGIEEVNHYPEKALPSLTQKQEKRSLAAAKNEKETAPKSPAKINASELFELAKKLIPLYENEPAFILKMKTALTILPDWRTSLSEERYIYINSQDFEVRTVLQDCPPATELTVQEAIMISPDGTLQKAEITPVNPGSSNKIRYTVIKFPDKLKGKIIKIVTKTDTNQTATIPFFSDSIEIQKQLAVKSAEIEIRYPKGKKPELRLCGLKAEAKFSEDTYSDIISYKFEDLKAFRSIPYSDPQEKLLGHIKISSMSDWNSFKTWYQTIAKGSDQLDESVKKIVAELCKDAQNDREKLRRIYEYICDMQYDTVPSGARAFRPRSPSELCRSGYGDCKDKANALVAMAKEAGIKGEFALLNRTGVSDKDFPSWQFNHALAYFPSVEGYPEGLWCDATDGSTPFGTLPPGDEGRDGLLVNAEGKAVFITVKQKEANLFSQHINLNDGKDGNLSGKMNIEASGFFDYQQRNSFRKASRNEQEMHMQKIIDAVSEGLTVSDVKAGNPLHYDGSYKVSCDLDGIQTGRANIPLKIWDYISLKSRDADLVISEAPAFSVKQEIRLKNSSFKTETRKIESPEFDAEIKFSGSGRDLLLNFKTTRISPERYGEFRQNILKLMKLLNEDFK